ncbi:hypothetical protein BGZ80_005978 [Entomortierella chlamydospora]|uniref:Chitin synthase activator n=1 Tax=Entomortierella chlamydospora TaxID=101097 RepID=A0A9P6MIL4_9FUNG|nr:hypothetical protein BGZ80_005978 [Entomortierella chlamydospora]
MSIQGPQNSSQGFRPIYNTGTSATPPQSSEPVYIEPHFISQTGEYIVLWDEVLVAFKNASYVRNGNTLVPFLRDENFQITSFEATPTARAPQLIDANLDFGNSLYNHIQPALPLSPQQSSRIQPQDFYNPPPPPPQQQYFPIPESKTNSDDIAISEYNQGLAYLKGNGVPQDYYKAMDIFHKAAKQGNPKAQCKLALLYYKGDGIPQDFSKAPKWFLRAANQDNGRAQAYLGNMYSMAKVSPRITPCL